MENKDWKEECAVVGVYNVTNAASMTYYSLFSMQHRGQEATGISSSNGEKIVTIKKKGLVTEVFDNESLSKLKGFSAIGHNRYSTAGEDSMADAQPIFARYDLGQVAIVHNGNLTNAKEIKQELIRDGAIFQSYMDTENLIHLIARAKQENLVDRIKEAILRLKGAFCFIILKSNENINKFVRFFVWIRRAGRPSFLVAFTRKCDILYWEVQQAVNSGKAVKNGEVLSLEPWGVRIIEEN